MSDPQDQPVLPAQMEQMVYQELRVLLVRQDPLDLPVYEGRVEARDPRVSRALQGRQASRGQWEAKEPLVSLVLREPRGELVL